MSKQILKGIILVAITTVFFGFETDLPKSAWKKVEKEWKKLWPDQLIKKEEIEIPLSINEGLGVKDLNYSLYKLHAGENRTGYMIISKAFGRYDFFDYMVIYNLDLTIRSAKVLIYRENWGVEIASTRWLKQFTGLSFKDPIAISHDIQGISGATISCKSATLGVKQLTLLIAKLREKDLLD